MRTVTVATGQREAPKMSASRKERAAEENKEAASSEAQSTPQIPEAVDDFLRNFLRRAGLSRTLSSFEAEWYGSARAAAALIPDALTHRQLLRSELEAARRETALLGQQVLAAGESLGGMQRERAFHRLQCRRVAEDKNRLVEDLRQLKKHLGSYGPALRQLDDKYQAALRQKMLLSIKRDRVPNPRDAGRKQEESQIKKEDTRRSESAEKSPARSPGARRPKGPGLITACSRLPDPHVAHKWNPPSSFSLSCSIRAHELPISCIDLHPRKRILASACDDRSWTLWALPAAGEKVGQMVLTGEGHSDWLSGCSFHPDGAKLATTSGDTTVRLWDFSRGCCLLMLSGHSQPTWGCSFHSWGHLLASCSGDGTAKLWDLDSPHCRLTLRRHTASVNSVCFLPFSNLLLTCSADKTLALWDARLGVCAATFHGHRHPCNHAAFSPAGNFVASCDSRGIINLRDIRKPALALATVDAGPQAANQVAFDPPGKTLAVASSDAVVRVVEVDSGLVSSLLGHSDGVQSVTFDHGGETVISAGSDGLINVWS